MNKKLLLLGVILLGGFTMANAKSWDKVFAKSDQVSVKKVHFKNRFGIKLAADLYTPKAWRKMLNFRLLRLVGLLGR